MNALLRRLAQMLPAQFAARKNELTRPRLYEMLDELFWKGHMDLLRHAVRARYSPAKFRAILQRQWGRGAVPLEWIIAEKFRYMKGLSNAPREEEDTMPGILRAPIANAPRLSLVKTSYRKPFHALPEKHADRFRVALISAPQLGLPYDDSDIVLNLTRCAISVARKTRCSALVISGGLFRLTWQKTTGPNRLLDDLVTGTEIDVESMAANYRARALEIIENGSFEPIFATALERFNDLLRGWYKVAMRPGKKPEFEGPVYIVLSPDELGLVRRMAYFELLYLQTQELHQAQSEERLFAKFSSEAHASFIEAQQNGDSKATIESARRAYEDARRQALEAAEKVARLRMTNLEPTQNRRLYNQALSYLVHKIEESIPNAKVIDQNTAYVTFGGSKHVIKFVSGGDINNPYYAELGGYGPTQRKGALPSLTVVSHPRATYMRKTSRENYLKGSMLGTVGFVEAPVLVDRDQVLERLNGGRAASPAVNTILDPMFNGGMLILQVDPALGVMSDFLSVETIRRMAMPMTRRGSIPSTTRKLWLMVATDPHFGGSMRVFLRRPSGMPIGLTEAACELMQKWGLDKNGAAPVAGFFVCDDILHGNHFGTHMRPHYHVRPMAAVLAEHERLIKELERKGRGAREKELLRALRLSVDQIRSRPPDYLTGQFMELFHGLLRPYADVFKGVLLAARNARVTVRGVSELSGVISDMRDVGVINFGSGNHATKTTDGMLHEGVLVAELLRMRLWGDPALVGMDLDRLVRAPLYQDQSIAFGTIKAGNGYEWGLHVSSTPPKRDSWLDVLHGWVNVNRSRGNPSAVLDGKSIIHLTGDKHFFAGAFAGGDVYVMGPSSTHTDGFADLAGGLPPNNAGIAFVGVPVDGPDAGEVSVVHLTPTTIQSYLTSGKPFPWDKLLPDRA